MTSSNSTLLKFEAQILITTLSSYQYPSVYPYVSKALIAFSVIYFLILLISILIIAIPLSRGPEARRKHLWLWRRQYPPGLAHQTPYFVPNGGIAVVISQIFGSTIFLIYIVLSYRAIKSSRFSYSQYQIFWLTISFSPGYFGFWYSGFSALYICLFSPNRPGPGCSTRWNHQPNPIFMNTVCISVPIVIALGSILWAIASIIVTREMTEAYDAVLSTLAAGQDPTEGIARFTVAGQRFIEEFRWASCYWSVAAFVAVVFYCFTIFLFLRLLKETVDVASGKISLLGQSQQTTVVEQENGPTIVIANPPTVETTSFGHNTPYAKKLRDGYRLLLWNCGLFTIVLTWNFVVGVLLTIKVGEMPDHEGWRSLSIWVVASGSGLLSGGLLLHSWRVLSDRDDNQIRQSRNPPRPTKMSKPTSTNDALHISKNLSTSKDMNTAGGMQNLGGTVLSQQNSSSLFITKESSSFEEA